MSLNESEIKELKDQLKSQLEHLEGDKKVEAEKHIDEMSPESIGLMLKQQQESMPKIYRSIISGEISAVKIEETPDFLAVLDNKPISQGHIVLIPKNPAEKPEDIPKSSYELAEKLDKKIKDNLKAKETKVLPEQKFGEYIINIIPIYDNPLDLKSERSSSSPEELETVKQTLETVKIEKKAEVIKEEPKEKESEAIQLKRRIP